MRELNLELIKDKTGIGERELSELLFKDVKNPILALRYVTDGRRELKPSEIERIEHITGISALEFYSEFTPKWRPERVPNNVQTSVIGFTRGAYTIRYRIGTGIATLTRNTDLLHSTHLTNKAITVGEFIEYFDNYIKKIEENEK